ncbi:MAG TPA: 50S ribosomal protein L11 methyltransferase [Haloplasmataceae bacterium]
MIRMKIHLPSDSIEPLLPILYRYGCQGIELISHETLTEKKPDLYGEIYRLNPNDYPKIGTIVLAYYPSAFDGMDMLIEEIRAHIPTLFEPIDVSTMEEVDYTQLYKENTEEICVGKLSIIPPWFNQRPPDRDYLIIEPGSAFGTGRHETTRSCLFLIERYLQPSMDVLDVGTGSGILALRAKMLTHGKVCAVEPDSMALKNARHNAALNHLKVSFFASIEEVSIAFDLIVANLTQPILVTLLPKMLSHLKPNGILIVSGILHEEKSDFEKVIGAAQLIVLERWKGKAFCSYCLTVKE